MASAELASQIQDEYLTCQICQGPYRVPKALPCLHTFCQPCLLEFVKSRAYDRAGQFPCPVCRENIVIPPGGIAAYPTNHLIVSLSDTVGQDVDPEDNAPDTAPQTSAQNQPAESDSSAHRTDRGGQTADSSAHRTADNAEVTEGDFVMISAEGRIKRFGRYGTGPWEMTDPVGLAVNSHCDIIVSDHSNNRILIFDKNGNPKFNFGLNCEIFDIACTKDGNDYIAVAVKTASSELIHMYNMSGVKVKTIGQSFSSVCAHGIAMNNKYTASTNLEGNNVYLFNDKGKMITMFGKRGHMYDQSFNRPYYVSLNQVDQILVSDYLNDCVKVFDTSGQLITKIGRESGTLKNPLGVCTDVFGNIIVADSGNKQIITFDASGKFLHTLVDYNVEMSDIHPKNVTLSPDMDKLIVLVTGADFAELRVYPYTLPSAKYGSYGKTLRSSSFCTCL